MTAATVKSDLATLASEVESHLERCLEGKSIPETLASSMRYSLLAGGKRLRPVLCLTWAELLGTARAGVMDFAAAIELIHTYSLVHDDLPAMDDDDLRRGSPSNHKVYGEAMAILAGDALLTEAFGLMARSAEHLQADHVICAIGAMARAAGAAGMVGGQALDMELTGRKGVTLTELRHMHSLKTGALIRASCSCGAILAGGDARSMEMAKTYGIALGAAFQIVDDILDVTGNEKDLGKPVGSDEGKGKNTYPSHLGLKESRNLAEIYVSRAKECLRDMDSPRADFLRDLAQYVVDRVS